MTARACRHRTTVVRCWQETASSPFSAIHGDVPGSPFDKRSAPRAARELDAGSLLGCSGGAGSGRLTWKTVPCPGCEVQRSRPPAFPTIRAAREAQAESSPGLAAAVERVEQVRRLGRIEPSAAVAEPPQELVFLHSRPDLDLAPGWRGLERVADQDIGDVPQGVGVDPRRWNRFVQLARETNSSRGAFLLHLPHRVAQQVRRAAGPGPGAGGRPTNIRSRRIRCVRPAWLIMIRSERAVSWSSVRESRSWARPTITASGLFSSCPAPAANSLKASSLRSSSRVSSVSLAS